MAEPVVKALKWDTEGERFYETGVDHVILFTKTASTVTTINGGYAAGVAWNGVTAMNEAPSGAEASALYADNIKYLNLIANEDYGGSIEAYQSPEEFDICDGSASPIAGLKFSQQARKQFAIAYRTKIGNDIDGTDKGFKLHIVYGCQATPSERQYTTINESPEAMTLSWDFTTTPVNVGKVNNIEYKPVAHVEIDSRYADEDALADLIEILEGKDPVEGESPVAGVASRLPMPAELYTLLTPST